MAPCLRIMRANDRYDILYKENISATDQYLGMSGNVYACVCLAVGVGMPGNAFVLLRQLIGLTYPQLPWAVAPLRV